MSRWEIPFSAGNIENIDYVFPEKQKWYQELLDQSKTECNARGYSLKTEKDVSIHSLGHGY